MVHVCYLKDEAAFVFALEALEQLGAVAELDDLAVAFCAGYCMPPVLVDHSEFLALRGQLQKS